MRVIALVNMKGGVGKSTSIVNLGCVFGEAYRVLVVDADANLTATEHLERAEELKALPAGLEHVAETDPRYLARVREVGGYDLVLVDTPGSRESATIAPVVRAADSVILPTPPAAYDVRGLAKTIRDVVQPTGVTYKILITRVASQSLVRAEEARTDLVEQGWSVFSTIIREYMAYDDAARKGVPMTTYRGRYAREADLDYRRAAGEILRDWPLSRADAS